ncbi:MAG: tetratricopeptide repeat protein [Desulfovibrionaceae bacterium]
MAEKVYAKSFEIVVSDKEGGMVPEDTVDGGKPCIYFYACKKGDNQIFLQPLNEDYLPYGAEQPLEEEVFLSRFQPEPLIYYNKVKPALENLKNSLEKADSLRKKGKHKLAENKYQEALSIAPDNLRATFGLGMTYMDSSQLDKGGVIFEKIIGLDLAFAPENKHLFNEFGIKLRKRRMFEEGLEYYHKALDYDPYDEHLHFNIARIHYEASDYAKALEHLTQAVELNPEFAPARDMLKIVQQKAG